MSLSRWRPPPAACSAAAAATCQRLFAFLVLQLAAAEEASGPQAIAQLREIVCGPAPNDAECLKVKEAALGKLADELVAAKDAPALRSLLTELRPLFAAIPKAKTAKIVRTIIDSIAKVPDSQQLLVSPRGMQHASCGQAGMSRGSAWPGHMHAAGRRRIAPAATHACWQFAKPIRCNCMVFSYQPLGRGKAAGLDCLHVS